MTVRKPPASLIPCALVVLLSIAGCAGTSAANGGNTSATKTLPTATNTPTPSPTASPTPAGPKPIEGATLGGTYGGFTAVYGQQVSDSTYISTVAGQRIQIMPDVAPNSDAQDGQPHVYVLDVQVPDDQLGQVSWDANTAAQIVAAFLPKDAKHLRDGPGAPAGVTDHIYFSTALAATFNAPFFTVDDGSHTVPPGSLHWQCNPYPPSTSGVGQCEMSVGTQY